MGRSRLAGAGAAWCLCALAGPVGAHPILITTGGVSWRSDAVVVSIAISGHDMEHAGFDAGAPDAPERFARGVGDSLAILDEEGHRLTLGAVSVAAQGGAPTAWNATMRYQLQGTGAGGLAGFLTFQQRPVDTPAAPIPMGDAGGNGAPPPPPSGGQAPRQVQLLVVGNDADTTIRLTSNGNAETVRVPPGGAERGAAGAASAGGALFDAESLRVITLHVHAGAADGPALVVEAPLSLLQTWVDLARADPDSLTLQETAALAPMVAKWAEVQVQPAGSVKADAAGVRWLKPGDSGESDAVRGAAARVGFWSARVRVPLMRVETGGGAGAGAGAGAGGGKGPLRWMGFNNAVRVVRVDDASKASRYSYLVQRDEGVELPGHRE